MNSVLQMKCFNCSGLGSAPAPGAVAGEGASHGARGGRAPQT